MIVWLSLCCLSRRNWTVNYSAKKFCNHYIYKTCVSWYIEILPTKKDSSHYLGLDWAKHVVMELQPTDNLKGNPTPCKESITPLQHFSTWKKHSLKGIWHGRTTQGGKIICTRLQQPRHNRISEIIFRRHPKMAFKIQQNRTLWSQTWPTYLLPRVS